MISLDLDLYSVNLWFNGGDNFNLTFNKKKIIQFRSALSMLNMHMTEKDIKELETFIQDLPLKYGLPLLNFLNSKVKEQTEKKEVEQTTE